MKTKSPSELAALAMAKTRSRLIERHPFWGCLALHLTIVERAEIGTMAVDGTSLFYAPKFVLGLSPAELEGVFVHELTHCMYGHITRRQGREVGLWNKACDYVVNPDVLAGRFVLPADRLLDPRFRGMGAEEVYSILSAERDKAESQQSASGTGQGQPQAGAGGSAGQSAGSAPGAAGGPATGSAQDPGGCGGVIDAAPSSQPAKLAEVEAEWQAATRTAVAAERSANRAKGIGASVGNAAFALEALNRAEVDWRGILREFIDQSVRKDYSWSSPSRRMLALGYTLPGLVPDGISHLVVAVDTSGSLTQEDLKAFAEEIGAAHAEVAPDLLTTIYADTAVRRVETFEPGDDFRMTAVGRGGTAFADTFRKIAALDVPPTAVIYLTDLEVHEFGEDPGCPVLWGVTGPSNRFADLASKAPFGEAIHVRGWQ